MNRSLLRACFWGLTAWFAIAARSAPAVEININYDTGAGSFPAYDPDGSKLEAIGNAARTIWKDLLPSNSHSYSVSIHWDNISEPGLLGQFNGFDHSLRFRANNAWFIDPTPLANEEFLPFQQTLYRDLSAGQKNAAFDGPVPNLLEVGYSASATVGGPASGVDDLLSVMLHEMGHFLEIGYNAFSPDVDLQQQFLGNVNGVKAKREDTGHIMPDDALMDPFISQGVRALPSALDLIVAAHEQNHSVLNVRRVDWFGDAFAPGVKFWFHGAGWEGGSKPKLSTSVQIRNGDTLQIAAESAFARDVRVSEDSILQVNDSLTVADDLLVDGLNFADTARVDVLANGFLNVDGTAFINTGAMKFVDGSGFINHVRIGSNNAGDLVPAVRGHGSLTIHGSLVNTGRIRGEGGTLQLNGDAGVSFDLDGDEEFSELTRGKLHAQLGDLQINRPLADPFSSLAVISGGRTIRFAGDWRFDRHSELWFAEAGAEAQFYSPFGGDSVVFHESTITVDDNVQAKIRASNIGFLAGPFQTDVQVGAEARLVLQGKILYQEGTFVGPGTLVQNGDATIDGDVTLGVVHYDWDGDGATPSNTHVLANRKLTIVADSLENGASGYAGQLDLESSGEVDVKITSGFGVWALGQEGRIRFLKSGKLSGAPVIVRGQIEAVDGTSELDAATTLTSLSHVTIHDGARLRINAATSYGGGVITTTTGQPDTSILHQSATATAFNHHVITVGFFNWDASSTSDSHTFIQPDAFLDIRTNEIGNGITDPALFSIDRFGFGDRIDINSGMLGVQLGGRSDPFANYWQLNAAGVLALNHVEAPLPTVRGATLRNRGTITGEGQFLNPLENQGLVIVGHDHEIGRLWAQNGYDQTENATLALELAGLVPGMTFDQLFLGAGGALSGQLVVTLENGFFPAVGNIFRIIDADPTSNITGTFSQLNLPGNPANWDVIYGPHYVDLRFIRPIPEPSTWALATILATAVVVQRRRRSTRPAAR